MDVIKVKHTSIVIPNYKLGDNEKIEKLLSIWNESYYRLEPIAYDYNEEKKELLIPRGLDINYLERSFNRPIEMDYNHDEAENVSYKLKKEPRNDIQRKSISYLMGENDFKYSKAYSQLTLNLDTGDGKTYCVIAALTFLNVKSLIITHIDNIKEQWMQSFLEMTNLDKNYLCNIEGSKMIDKLFATDNLKYKVYFVNHGTLKSYAKKHGWDKIGELFKKLKIGVKVYDEAHKEFENILKVDLHTNTKKTFYLTATFERTGFEENKLFNLCFKGIAKYGIETRAEKRKHIIYVAVLYNSRPDIVAEGKMIGIHGFDKNKYIDYQLSKDIFFDVIKYVLDYFQDKEGKTLILLSKIDATEKIYKFLKEEYTEKSISLYNSKVSDEDKLKAKSSDIISSTPKSLGTGFDIPGLRFNIMTEQYSSPITAKQISGRLREYGPDEYTFHIELIDYGFKKVYGMYKKRLKYFKDRCAKILELRYKY